MLLNLNFSQNISVDDCGTNIVNCWLAAGNPHVIHKFLFAVTTRTASDRPGFIP